MTTELETPMGSGLSGQEIVWFGSELQGLLGGLVVDQVCVSPINTSFDELPALVSCGMQYRTRSAPVVFDPLGEPTVWNTMSYGVARSSSLGTVTGLSMFRSWRTI